MSVVLSGKTSLKWTQCISKLLRNKKVLLRVRKRHTARRVVITPAVVLHGYPPGQGTPPRQGTPPLARVPPRPGYPPWTGYPPGQGTPPWLDLAGYPPPSWTWQGTPPAAPWHSRKCCKALWDLGTPPPGVNKLTK